MLKNALNRRPVQFLLSGLIIGSTIIAIVSPTSLFFLLGANASSYIMLSLFAIGFCFFTIDNRSLMMLSFSACATLCLILKQDQSHSSYLIGNQLSSAAINIAFFEPSNEKNNFCNLLEIMEGDQPDGIIISSIPGKLSDKISLSLKRNGYTYFFQHNTDKELGTAYFYKSTLKNALEIYGQVPSNDSIQKKLIKNTRLDKLRRPIIDPLNSLLELKNYNFVGQLDCNCSFSANHRGSILIYEFDSNAKKTS